MGNILRLFISSVCDKNIQENQEGYYSSAIYQFHSCVKKLSLENNNQNKFEKEHLINFFGVSCPCLEEVLNTFPDCVDQFQDIYNLCDKKNKRVLSISENINDNNGDHHRDRDNDNNDGRSDGHDDGSGNRHDDRPPKNPGHDDGRDNDNDNDHDNNDNDNDNDHDHDRDNDNDNDNNQNGNKENNHEENQSQKAQDSTASITLIIVGCGIIGVIIFGLIVKIIKNKMHETTPLNTMVTIVPIIQVHHTIDMEENIEFISSDTSLVVAKPVNYVVANVMDDNAY